MLIFVMFAWIDQTSFGLVEVVHAWLANTNRFLDPSGRILGGGGTV